MAGCLEEDCPACESFEDMRLPEGLLRGLYSNGYERPSAIQQRAIPAIGQGRDAIVQAASGSGKTLGCLVGVLQRVDCSRRECQALILTPTRELAQNIVPLANCLGQHLGLCAHACHGGVLIRADREALTTGPQLVVGTPGRIVDQLRRRAIRSNGVRTMVLEEVDEMLGRGFHEQLRDIISMLPAEVQGCLTSVTMPPEVVDLAARFMESPARITIRAEELTAEGVRQYHVDVEREERKVQALCDLCDELPGLQAVVFLNTRLRLEALAQEMRRRDFTVSVMHGDADKLERTAAVQAFQSGAARLLLCTDLLARSVCVPRGRMMVVSYDVPRSADSYLLRVSRGGCSEPKSAAITFATHEEMTHLRAIEQHAGVRIDALPADLAGIA